MNKIEVSEVCTSEALEQRGIPEEVFNKMKPFYRENLALSIKYAGKHVVADFYNIGKQGKAFNMEMKEKKRSKFAVEMAHVFAVNSQWDNNGKLYIVLEPESDQYNKDLAADIAKRKKVDGLKLKGAAALTAAIENVGKISSEDLAAKEQEEFDKLLEEEKGGNK